MERANNAAVRNTQLMCREVKPHYISIGSHTFPNRMAKRSEHKCFRHGEVVIFRRAAELLVVPRKMICQLDPARKGHQRNQSSRIGIRVAESSSNWIGLSGK